MATRWFLSNDGNLHAPRRGRPPACPDGYTIDPTDPFRAIPIIPECEYRTSRVKDYKCCDSITLMVCGFNNKDIHRGVCKNCQANPKEYW